ncbi:CASP-like protein 3A1 [Triticum dicoccoides]|uniref:CASP-like protein 3A1 n=1 Tax=Triticum dicoccoides TaxID=85692 RepID=UPI00188E0F49|nr:CASP-like protein 3A1 [Triticum dicoccoides]
MGSFANGQNGSELGIQMPAMGSSAVPEPPTTSVAVRCPRLDMAMVATRAAALVMALLSMSLMVSAKQRGSLIIFGIEIPLYAKWSLSDSMKSLVGLSAEAAAYSLAQLLSIAYKALKKVPVVPSRRYAWMLLAGDQVCYDHFDLIMHFLVITIVICAPMIRFYFFSHVVSYFISLFVMSA